MARPTTDGGAAFAGGHPIESPLGVIYTSNITPDPDTGIGGIDAHGPQLYPAAL